MTYAALMAHVHAHPDGEPRLRLAADIADQLDARLIGVAAECYSPPPSDADPRIFGGETAMKEIDEQIAAELRDAETRFLKACGAVKKGVEWRAFTGSPTGVIAQQSRAADLVICGVDGAPPGDIERQASPSDLLMATGRPVLTGPADVDCLDLRKIVLAWKDTREARRAVADAMPLLARAEQVLIVAAPDAEVDEDPMIGLADVAEAIRRHGGRPTPRVLPGRRPADSILEAAVDFDAQLIVAGGYGHMRLREWAFGGVTQHLLRQEAKFVLLSH